MLDLLGAAERPDVDGTHAAALDERGDLLLRMLVVAGTTRRSIVSQSSGSEMSTTVLPASRSPYCSTASGIHA